MIGERIARPGERRLWAVMAVPPQSVALSARWFAAMEMLFYAAKSKRFDGLKI
jgi:hypothetical protein